MDSIRDLPVLIRALWLVRRRLSAVVEAASAGEWDAVQQASTRLMNLLDVRLTISGSEHIDPGERYVVALHEGFMDVIALLQLPRTSHGLLAMN